MDVRADLNRVLLLDTLRSNGSLLSFTHGGFGPDDSGGDGVGGNGFETVMRSTDADFGAAGEGTVRPVREGVNREEDLDEEEEGESGMSGLSYEYLR
jgi:hypothetical protein